MEEFDMGVHKHVRDAIYLMLQEEPFFGHIAFGVRWYQNTKLDSPSIVTDGLSISYNPEYIRKMMNSAANLDTEAHTNANMDAARVNLRNAIGKVCLKIALRHAFRAVNHNMDDKRGADIASDIASHLVVSTALPGGVHACMGSAGAIQLASRQKLIFEQIYEALPKGVMGGMAGSPSQKDAPSSGLQKPGDGEKHSEGKSGPHSAQGTPSPDEGDQDGEGSGDDMSDKEYEIKKLTNNAIAKAQKAGKLPGVLKQAVDESYQGRKDWRDEIRRFLGGGELPQQSWSKPNRRYVADDIYLPGTPKEGPGVVVLAIDTSGSINDALLNKFIAEVRKINVDMQPECIHVVCCDARVQWTAEFGPYDDVKAEPKGRGGTAFSPVFKWVRERGINPKALMYFTDGECNDYGGKPDYPVLWIVWPGGSPRKPPFGETIRM